MNLLSSLPLRHQLALYWIIFDYIFHFFQILKSLCLSLFIHCDCPMSFLHGINLISSALLWDLVKWSVPAQYNQAGVYYTLEYFVSVLLLNLVTWGVESSRGLYNLCWGTMVVYGDFHSKTIFLYTPIFSLIPLSTPSEFFTN